MGIYGKWLSNIIVMQLSCLLGGSWTITRYLSLRYSLPTLISHIKPSIQSLEKESEMHLRLILGIIRGVVGIVGLLVLLILCIIRKSKPEDADNNYNIDISAKKKCFGWFIYNYLSLLRNLFTLQLIKMWCIPFLKKRVIFKIRGNIL